MRRPSGLLRTHASSSRNKHAAAPTFMWMGQSASTLPGRRVSVASSIRAVPRNWGTVINDVGEKGVRGGGDLMRWCGYLVGWADPVPRVPWRPRGRASRRPSRPASCPAPSGRSVVVLCWQRHARTRSKDEPGSMESGNPPPPSPPTTTQ